MALDQVDPKDIKDNLNTAETMQAALDKLRRQKKSVLANFETFMRALDDEEKAAADCIKTAFDRCKYHADLKKQIESGKTDPKREDELNKRVKYFIGIVKKEDAPRLDGFLKEFQDTLGELAKLLK